MRTAERVLSVVVMVISALMLVLSPVGIAGSWIVRGQLLSDMEQIVTAAESRAETVQQELNRLGSTLVQVADEVAAVERGVQGLGADADLDENSLPLSALSDRLDLELGSLIDKADEIMAKIRETVTAVNAIVEGINALPFVTRRVADPEALNKLSEDLDGLMMEAEDLRNAVDRAQSEIVEGAVALIVVNATRIGDMLETMQARVSGYSQEVDRLREGLSSLQAAVRRWLTWGAVALTAILSWLALSQIALAVLAWRAFLGQDVLPRRGGSAEDSRRSDKGDA